jgi:predicted DNA binding CopG/RHH family protein
MENKKRIILTIHEDTLKALDYHAVRLGISRNGYISMILTEHIGKVKK